MYIDYSTCTGPGKCVCISRDLYNIPCMKYISLILSVGMHMYKGQGMRIYKY